MNVQPDEVWWKPEKSGKFSVKGYYFQLQENNSMLVLFCHFQGKLDGRQRPLKGIFSAWPVAHQAKIITLDRNQGSRKSICSLLYAWERGRDDGSLLTTMWRFKLFFYIYNFGCLSSFTGWIIGENRRCYEKMIS